MEATARRGRKRTGQFARHGRGQTTAGRRIGGQPGRGRQQGLRIGMRRTLQQIFPRAFFHNLPQIHDHDARAHETHHRKIMGNKQIGGTEAILSIPQQIKNLRLNRGIQSGHGLVADDQIGTGDKSARHGDTLPLPAGKLVRIAPLHTCKADGGENLGHGAPTGFRRQFPLRAVPTCQRRKRFFHGLPDAHPGVQRGKGVLKDHLHAPCQRTFCPCRGQGPALKQNFARAGRQQAAGKTPMYEALLRVRDLLGEWCANDSNRDSFPPVVINITDGEASDCTDDELRRVCTQIRRLGTDDGNVLLFNIHVSTDSTSPAMVFPMPDELARANPYARLLAECSSIMPEAFDEAVRDFKGAGAVPPFYGMGYNTSIIELLSIINIGSRSITNIE